MSDTIEAIPVNESVEEVEHIVTTSEQTIPVEQAIDEATQIHTDEPTNHVKPKAKRGCRPKGSGKGLNLRDKKACDDCGKTFSVHTLTYSHDAYCPAKKEKRKTEEIIRQHIGPQSVVGFPSNLSGETYVSSSAQRFGSASHFEAVKPETKVIYQPRELNEDEEQQVYHKYISKMREKIETEKKERYKKLISLCIN